MTFWMLYDFYSKFIQFVIHRLGITSQISQLHTSVGTGTGTCQLYTMWGHLVELFNILASEGPFEIFLFKILHFLRMSEFLRCLSMEYFLETVLDNPEITEIDYPIWLTVLSYSGLPLTVTLLTWPNHTNPRFSQL